MTLFKRDLPVTDKFSAISEESVGLEFNQKPRTYYIKRWMWWIELIFLAICSLLAVGFYVSAVVMWSAQVSWERMFLPHWPRDMISQWDDWGCDVCRIRAEAFLMIVRFSCVALEPSLCNKKNSVSGSTAPSVQAQKERHVEAFRVKRCHSPHVKWARNKCVFFISH